MTTLARSPPPPPKASEPAFQVSQRPGRSRPQDWKLIARTGRPVGRLRHRSGLLRLPRLCPHQELQASLCRRRPRLLRIAHPSGQCYCLAICEARLVHAAERPGRPQTPPGGHGAAGRAVLAAIGGGHRDVLHLLVGGQTFVLDIFQALGPECEKPEADLVECDGAGGAGVRGVSEYDSVVVPAPLVCDSCRSVSHSPPSSTAEGPELVKCATPSAIDFQRATLIVNCVIDIFTDILGMHFYPRAATSVSKRHRLTRSQ